MVAAMSNRYFIIASLATVTLSLSGCVSTIGSVVTAPVKAVGKVADWTTTSQDEADRNRGRKLREREERLGRLARQRDKYQPRCERGDADACAKVDSIDAQIAVEQARPI
jgi:hypothetical protein